MSNPEQLHSRLLEGKTALITGGANGIGRAIAETALREGASIVLFDVNQERLDKTTDELATYGTVYSYNVDVLDKPAIEVSINEFENRSGKYIDTLINNAGIAPSGSIVNMSDKLWEKTLAVNLTGARNMTQVVSKKMSEHQINKGSITFITSMITAQSVPNFIAYEASKHGVVGLMRSTAYELAPHIRANAVAPGLIAPTGITDAMPERYLQKTRTIIPLEREGTPQDVAEVVVFLASDRARYVTGAEWRVDGGVSVFSPVAVG